MIDEDADIDFEVHYFDPDDVDIDITVDIHELSTPQITSALTKYVDPRVEKVANEGLYSWNVQKGGIRLMLTSAAFALIVAFASIYILRNFVGRTSNSSLVTKVKKITIKRSYDESVSALSKQVESIDSTGCVRLAELSHIATDLKEHLENYSIEELNCMESAKVLVTSLIQALWRTAQSRKVATDVDSKVAQVEWMKAMEHTRCEFDEIREKIVQIMSTSRSHARRDVILKIQAAKAIDDITTLLECKEWLSHLGDGLNSTIVPGGTMHYNDTVAAIRTIYDREDSIAIAQAKQLLEKGLEDTVQAFQDISVHSSKSNLIADQPIESTVGTPVKPVKFDANASIDTEDYDSHVGSPRVCNDMQGYPLTMVNAGLNVDMTQLVLMRTHSTRMLTSNHQLAQHQAQQSRDQERVLREERARRVVLEQIERHNNESVRVELELESQHTKRLERREHAAERLCAREEIVLQELFRIKCMQYDRDFVRFVVLYLVATVCYIAVLTGFDIYAGSISGSATWILGLLRSLCGALSCEEDFNKAGSYDSNSNHHWISSNSVHSFDRHTTGSSVGSNEFYSVVRDTATAITSTGLVLYQSTYRRSTSWVLCYLLQPFAASLFSVVTSFWYTQVRTPFDSTLTQSREDQYFTVYGNHNEPTELNYIGEDAGKDSYSYNWMNEDDEAANSFNSGEETEDNFWSWAMSNISLYETGTCVGHLVWRILPSYIVSRCMMLLRLSTVGTTVSWFILLLCFLDVLLTMALGPLRPLLMLGVLHTIIFSLIRHFDVHYVRWNVTCFNQQVDVRGIVLYLMYGFVFVLLSCIVGYMQFYVPLNQGSTTLGDKWYDDRSTNRLVDYLFGQYDAFCFGLHCISEVFARAFREGAKYWM